jgi:hypothetical protein
MSTRFLTLGCCVAFCVGGSCQVNIGGDREPGYVKLDDANTVITIRASMAAAPAQVVARITSGGEAIDLQNGQSVSVNGVNLVGPDLKGEYSATITRSTEYEIVVNEPTRGVQNTTVFGPKDFAITAPAAGETISLANGFALTWTHPNPTGLQATIALSQSEANQVRIIGPVADTGTRTVTHADLSVFRQWPSLPIKLTKTAQVSSVAGFASAIINVELSLATSVVPGP